MNDTSMVLGDELIAWQDIRSRDFPLLLDRKGYSYDGLTTRLGLPKREMWPITELLMRMRGVPIDYSDSHLQYFLKKGTAPVVLYGYLADHGITQEENQALESVGMSLAVKKVSQLNGWHIVAMAEEVVEGKVTEVEGIVGEPYHTRVRLDLTKVFKSCSNFPERGYRDFWLPMSGPYFDSNGGKQVHRDPAEPQLRVGERVVVVAGSNPRNLRRIVLNMITPFIEYSQDTSSLELETVNAMWDNLSQNWGDVDRLLEMISYRLQKRQEIHKAFKVTRRNLVVKSDADRIPDPLDRIGRDQFEERLSEIYDAQRKYCEARPNQIKVGEM